MARPRTTHDLCQTCWQDENPTEYAPMANRYGTCAECGIDAFVTRATVEAERIQALQDDFSVMHNHGGYDCMCYESEYGPSNTEARVAYVARHLAR